MDLSPLEIAALESVGLDGHCLGEIDSNEKFSTALLFARISDRGYLEAVIGERGATYFLTTLGAMALETAKP